MYLFRFYILSEAWEGKDNEHKDLILKFGSLSFLRNNVLTLKTQIGFFLIENCKNLGHIMLWREKTITLL